MLANPAYGSSSQLPPQGHPQDRAWDLLPGGRAGRGRARAGSPLQTPVTPAPLSLRISDYFHRLPRRRAAFGAPPPQSHNLPRRETPLQERRPGPHIPEGPCLQARPSNLRSPEGPGETRLVKEGSAGQAAGAQGGGTEMTGDCPWAGPPPRASSLSPARLGQNPGDGKGSLFGSLPRFGQTSRQCRTQSHTAHGDVCPPLPGELGHGVPGRGSGQCADILPGPIARQDATGQP